MIKYTYLFAITTAYLLGACASRKYVDKQRETQIIIENQSSVKLTDKAIAIKRSSIKRIPLGINYPVVVSSNNDTIPSQLDDLNEDKNWDELFMVVNLEANSKSVYTLTWVSNPPKYTVRTSVRFGKRPSINAPVMPATSETVLKNELPKALGFQRYQTDGPSWENDKVGFRHYLDGRNSKDVFGKKISGMSPEDVGIGEKGAVEDNYHVMKDWGRDILAVGNSIGIGGVALSEGDRLMRLGVTITDSVNNVKKTDFNIVSEGPVRSILKFDYQNWKPLNKNYQVTETTSIWPGMYAFHNSVKISGISGKENLALGIVNINAAKPPTEIKVNDEWIAIISHDRHGYNKEWLIGLALLVPAKSYINYTEAPKTGQLATSYMVNLKIANNVPVNYFAIAGWEISDKGFSKEDYFKAYVLNLAAQITVPVTVKVN